MRPHPSVNVPSVEGMDMDECRTSTDVGHQRCIPFLISRHQIRHFERLSTVSRVKRVAYRVHRWSRFNRCRSSVNGKWRWTSAVDMLNALVLLPKDVDKYFRFRFNVGRSFEWCYFLTGSYVDYYVNPNKSYLFPWRIEKERERDEEEEDDKYDNCEL